MRGFITWLLAVIAWALILWLGRMIGVHPSAGEIWVVGSAGGAGALIIAGRES